MTNTFTQIRPFVFSTPASGRNRMPGEKTFPLKKNPHTGEWIPAEITLSNEEAAHDFFKVHYADGCIERPEVTAARIEAEQKARKKKDEDDARELQKAQDALKRASGAHEVHQINENDVARQLNTPVNQLGAQQGKDIGKPIDEKALALELNTPVNKLAGKK